MVLFARKSEEQKKAEEEKKIRDYEEKADIIKRRTDAKEREYASKAKLTEAKTKYKQVRQEARRNSPIGKVGASIAESIKTRSSQANTPKKTKPASNPFGAGLFSNTNNTQSGFGGTGMLDEFTGSNKKKGKKKARNTFNNPYVRF